MKDLSEILDRFFSGNCTEDEKTLITRLIQEGEEGLFDSYCKELWNNVDSTALSPDVRARIKARVMARISGRATGKRNSGMKWLARVSVAAVLLITAVLAGWNLAKNRPSEIFEVVALRGQKSTLTLPDGTMVKLNSASTISYSSDYNVANRDVYLQGEAYFDVAGNQAIPFVVHTQGLAVKVTGTKFNVKAYAEEDIVTATLVEGNVLADAGGQTYELSPYHEVAYDRISGDAVVYPIPECEHAIPWVRDEILFDNDSLSEIASVLGRMYNVNIVFEDERITEFTYTGLVRNNSLQNVLDLISGTSPVRYVIEDGDIRFMHK